MPRFYEAISGHFFSHASGAPAGAACDDAEPLLRHYAAMIALMRLFLLPRERVPRRHTKKARHTSSAHARYAYVSR